MRPARTDDTEGFHMVLRKHQGGLTFIGLLFILGLIGFFTLVGLKLFPIYMESFKVDSVLTSLIEDPDVTNWSKPEIRKRFVSRVDVEDLDRFNERNLAEYMTITKLKDGVSIDLAYQAEAHLFANLTLVADFQKSVSTD